MKFYLSVNLICPLVRNSSSLKLVLIFLARKFSMPSWRHDDISHRLVLTLILLTWTIWRAPTNASKWRMGLNSAFKWLIWKHSVYKCTHVSCVYVFMKISGKY